MSWSYGDPNTSPKDAVRLLIGDTDINDQQLSDEDITYFLAQKGSVPMAAGSAARAIAAKYARKVSYSVGDLQKSYSDLQKSYLALAAQLENTDTLQSAVPYFAGMNKADRQTDANDSSLIQPRFKRGQMDFPGTQGVGEDG